MSSHAALHAPVGGPLWTRPFRLLVAIFAVCALFFLYRFAAGLGASTALNDGYPWGIWIAFDVVVGTALGCGGYAVALLVYVLNKGEYHPLVRPAILTSALGYTMASVSIHFDVGRPWLLWRIPVFSWEWNLNSALLEVALCVMAYVAVLWIELSPAFMERWRQGPEGFLRRTSEKLYAPVQKALPWVIALGLLLPTMHQSSLGTVMLLTGPKLHPLWNTPWLPLLFLVSCLGMGYAVVVFESALAARFLRRKPETEMLGRMARVLVPVLAFFTLLRFGDLAVRGRLGALGTFDLYTAMFLLETALFLAPAFLLLSEKRRRDAGCLFRSSILMILAGTLYRFDTYLVAFRPGERFAYFPSVPEILVTVGIVALEVILYVVVVTYFPVLSAEEPAPVAPARA